MNIPDYSTLDMQEMATAMGINVKHIPILIASFLEESQEILKNLEDAIASKDYEAITYNAHSIKGSAGNLRFNEIYEIAKSIETAGINSDTSFEYIENLTAMKKGIATICI